MFAARNVSPADSIRSRGRILFSIIILFLLIPLGFVNPSYEEPLLRMVAIIILIFLVAIGGLRTGRPIGSRSLR
jgi:hypothetical protein